MKLPRVLILYTGGTFGMEVISDPRTSEITLAIPQLSAKKLEKRFFHLAPEIKKIAQCDVEIILNQDSAHIGPSDWVRFAEHIRAKWKNYDGVVLLHGTDTLSYSACALSFLLRPCLKPVVITGAQRPLSAIRNDAKNNLISAVEIAANGPKDIVKQVTVLFGDKLFQGNHVRKKSAADFSAFESPYSPPLASIGTTIRYVSSLGANWKKPLQRIEKLKPRFSKRVLVTHITPGFPASVMTEPLLSSLEGIILVVYPSGTAPTHDPQFLRFLEETQIRKIPVILSTENSAQPPQSYSAISNYEAGTHLLKYGCFWAGHLTLECAYVKTALILGQSTEFEAFKKLWYADLSHES